MITDHMKPPAKFESKNLLIRKLQKADAQEIFDNYANQADILDYVSWKPHQTLEDTYQILNFAQKSWNRETISVIQSGCE